MGVQAVAGGETIGGRFFKGGQFIPKEFVELKMGMTGRTIDETHKVREAAERATFKNLGHAAAAIRKTAARSIETSPEPSLPGEPPHTRRGNRIRRSLRYAREGKERAVIGPLESIMGIGGERLEEGTEFEARPFMGPALEENLDRFASGWGASIG